MRALKHSVEHVPLLLLRKRKRPAPHSTQIFTGTNEKGHSLFKEWPGSSLY
jgi:hypothetical protein